MSDTEKRVVENSADVVLAEVWRAKDTLSASYGHDVGKLFAHARDQQNKSTRRVVNRPAARPLEQPR